MRNFEGMMKRSSRRALPYFRIRRRSRVKVSDLRRQGKHRAQTIVGASARRERGPPQARHVANARQRPEKRNGTWGQLRLINIQMQILMDANEGKRARETWSVFLVRIYRAKARLLNPQSPLWRKVCQAEDEIPLGWGSPVDAQTRSLLSTESGISSTGWEQLPSRQLAGTKLDTSRLTWVSPSRVNFFKEMTIRDIIIGINLKGSKPLSQESQIVKGQPTLRLSCQREEKGKIQQMNYSAQAPTTLQGGLTPFLSRGCLARKAGPTVNIRRAPELMQRNSPSPQSTVSRPQGETKL